MLANKSEVSKQLSAGYSQEQIYILVDAQTHLKQLVKLDPFPKDPGQNKECLKPPGSECDFRISVASFV